MYQTLHQSYGNWKKAKREGYHDTESKKACRIFIMLLIIHLLLASIAVYCILQYSDSIRNLFHIDKWTPLMSTALIMLCFIPDIGMLFSLALITICLVHSH